MVEILVKDGSLYVKSEYDRHIVSFMRSRPRRFWDTKTREWKLPESDLDLLIQALSGYEYNINHADNLEKMEESLNSSSKEIKNLIPEDYNFKTKPFKYQLDGINYGLAHDKYLLADSPGLGKSLQAMYVSQLHKEQKSVKHTLIVACVNSLKYNWQAEVEKHTNEKGYILGTRYTKSGREYIGSNEDRLDDINSLGSGGSIDNCYYIITNIETLRYNKSIQVPLKTKKNGVQRFKKQTVFPIIEAIQKQIEDGNINMIICDEMHKCLSGDTKIMTNMGAIPISEIVEKQCYRVATLNQDNTISFVTPSNYFKNPVEQEMVQLILAKKDVVTNISEDRTHPHILSRIYDPEPVKILCTNDHKFLMIGGKYVSVDEITVGNGFYGDYVCIDKYTVKYGDYTYDIEIPENHNYILESGIVSHNCKDPASLQGRALLALDCDYKIALTGTPVMNQPIDLYTILNWIGYEDHSFYAFRSHYCIMGGFGQHQIVGYKNLPELQSVLDKCMLRRLKKDVLDLPEKIYINDYVEMTKEQIKLYEEVRNNIIDNIDKIKLSPNPLVQLIRLRQVTGNPNILSSAITKNPKFDRMLEIVEDVVANDGKCLVFSNWTDMIDPAYELLQKHKYQPAMYTGKNKDVREQEKDRFMTDPKCKVFLGTMDAMGTGLTLTAANTVIFLDEPWNRAKKDQCEDRVHRIGTKDSPNIITIMCKGTIDERINDLITKKGKMSDVLIDKEEDLMKNPKIVNYLLSIDQ